MMSAIIIPTYNEKQNIGSLIDLIFQFFPKARVVVVDDNSPDKTKDVVRKKQKNYSRLELIVRKHDKGRGASVIEGMHFALKKYSDVSYFIEMDSDFSHNPKDVSRPLKAADQNAVSIGSRYVMGSKIIDWPLKRIVLSKIANTYIRFFLGVPIKDYTMGFRCYSRRALESLDLSHIKHKGFITLSETAYKLYQKDFQFKEIPITLKDRTKGKSNANLGEVLKSFLAILSIRFRSNHFIASILRLIIIPFSLSIWGR